MPKSIVTFADGMDLKERIWDEIGAMKTPGFFVTAEMQHIGKTMPTGLEAFVEDVLKRISEGVKSRRFVYVEGEWRMYLTFFPTTEVVDERYALKNKVVKIRRNIADF